MTSTTKDAPAARWRKRLDKELAYVGEFSSLNAQAWRVLLRSRSVTSTNHDTIVSLDWPHYCAHATIACGGAEGWCYTFQGRQATGLHNRHAAMVDVLAKKEPVIFGEAVELEVRQLVERGSLAYPNVRFSGSGEVIEAYLPALQEVVRRGIRLWGFTRGVRLAQLLRDIGAAVIVSCDKTSSPEMIARARAAGLPLAYSSTGVDDRPPEGTLVTFPVHRVGRVHEVVDMPNLCPKVLSDYFNGDRPEGYCQQHCSRCHLGKLAS